jgi:hypothetical protein
LAFGCYTSLPAGNKPLWLLPLGPLVFAFMGWTLFIFVFGLRYGGLNITVARNFAEVMLAVSLFFLIVNQVKPLTSLNWYPEPSSWPVR